MTCLIGRGQNLVPNPSFEDTIACPSNVDPITALAGWSAYRETPDYYHACSSPPFSSVPENIFGNQAPATGNAYCGLYTYLTQFFYREHIGTMLTSPLVPGMKYFVSLKVALSDTVDYSRPTNRIGVKFFSIPYSFSNPSAIDNRSHVYSNSVITNTTNWTKISGTFIADSAYSYIAVGNFFDDTATTINGSNSQKGGYYFVDDICVSTDSLACNPKVGIQQINQNESVKLFPNPFSTQLTFSLADNKPTTVSLYNFLGQRVLQQSFTNSTTLNTAQLADGIYFYELRSNKGTLKTGKLVKQ